MNNKKITFIAVIFRSLTELSDIYDRFYCHSGKN